MTQIQQELLIFVAIPVAYSIGFFGWCYLAEQMPVFSKRNARSISAVAGGHMAVVLLFILLAQTASAFYSSLPDWFIDRTFTVRGGKESIFRLSCLTAVLLIGWAEKRWIYVDSGVDQPEADSDRD